MHDIGQALLTAVALIRSFDPELTGIVTLSLRVSLSAAVIAMVIGAPIGGALAVRRFRGRQTVFWPANALSGLTPGLVGLLTYILLLRSVTPGFWRVSVAI